MQKKKPRKRSKIKGHYMQVRQRSTKKGKKGTIMNRWKSEKRGKKRVYRCELPISSRLHKFCENKKAGSHCLKGGDSRDRCPKLVIAYQQ